MTLASRIGVMDRGVLVQVGTPREVYESPVSRFVADFVGTVNLFEGELVAQSEGRARIRCAELERSIHVERAPNVALGSRVWAAIRPEKIEIDADLDEPPPSDNSVEGIVREIAYLGGASTYLIEIGSGRTLRVSRQNLAHDAALKLRRSDAVRLHWHAASPVVLTQ